MSFQMGDEISAPMPNIPPSYDDCLRIFRQEIDEHLHWAEAQSYYGLLTLEPGWRMPPGRIFEQLEALRQTGKIPSERFTQTLSDFLSLYVH